MAKLPQNKSENPPSTDSGSNRLEVLLDQQIGDLVPQKSREQIVARISTVVMSEHFTGPIAHPKHLREYENVCEGAADRIISMAEKQQAHHSDMDDKVLKAEIDDRKRGMLIGGFTFLCLIACALLAAIFTESEIIPGLFLGTAALGGVGLFVKGRQNGN